MKKLTALLLALVMVLSLAACGAKETTPETKAPEAAAPVETKAPVEEAPAAPTSLNIYGIYKSESPYFVNEAASIEKALNDKGAEYGIEVTWHFLNCDGDAEKYMTQIDTAIADNADAIVTCIPDQTMSEAVVAKCEAAGVLIVACDDPLKDGDNNKLAPWFGIDAYNIGYAAGEWMADYATENNMTEDETVVLLSKGEVDSKKIRVEFSLEDMDMSEFQDGATYPQIKEYVLEHTGLKVSNLYISQIKRKCGIEVGKNYNLPKSEDSRQPQCPPEKEKAIREAFKYFGMI